MCHGVTASRAPSTVRHDSRTTSAPLREARAPMPAASSAGRITAGRWSSPARSSRCSDCGSNRAPTPCRRFGAVLHDSGGSRRSSTAGQGATRLVDRSTLMFDAGDVEHRCPVGGFRHRYRQCCYLPRIPLRNDRVVATWCRRKALARPIRRAVTAPAVGVGNLRTFRCGTLAQYVPRRAPLLAPKGLPASPGLQAARGLKSMSFAGR